MIVEGLKALLDTRNAFYETPAFIPPDPISIPHRFSKKQDIEIAGLFAATLAWGHRSIIIRNSARLMDWMDSSPHDFILHHQETDLKRFLHFAHRTFNATDALYFIHFLRHHYTHWESLQAAFFPEEDFAQRRRDAEKTATGGVIELGLRLFHDYFFSLPDAPTRTRKHVPTPARNSACKRLCMYLRWMVRPGPVDFGIWDRIAPADLICPLDTHVARVAFRLGLLTREKSDWRAAVELTTALRAFDPSDPARYDFALFSLGADERF